MATRSLGTLTLDLILKMGGFTQGMDQAARQTDKRMREIEKRANAFGRSIGASLRSAGAEFIAFAGVTLSVGVALQKFKGAIDLADETRDLSIRLGTSTETLSAFGYAATQTGTDMETLGKGLKVLAKNAADSLNPTSEQAKVFDALGVKVTDAEGKLRDLGEMVPEIADKFASLKDGTTKAALAQALFGRAGLDLTEFLNSGAQGLDEFAKKASELGIVIDTETAAKADAFNDTLGDLKALTSGLALAVAQELLPGMTEVAKNFADTGQKGEKLKETARSIAEFFKILGTLASGTATAFNLVGTGLATIAAQASASLKFLSGDVQGGLALYREASEGFNRELDEAFGNDKAVKQTVKLHFAGEGPDPAGLFKASPEEAALREERDKLAAALAEALSNPTGGKTGGKAEKSEAEKEAERLQQAYERLRDTQLEQIELFGKTGDAAKVRYDIEHGELAQLSKEKQEELLQGAQKLDQMKLQKELQDAADEAVQRETDAFNDRQKQANDQRADMAFELSLLGMSNKERERAIALKYADVDATSELGKSIADMSYRLYEARKAAQAWDDFQRNISDSLADLFTGTKGVTEVLKDFFDTLAQQIARSISEGWSEKITGLVKGSASTSNGGTSAGSGNFFANLLGALFGGQRASGGTTMAGKIYEVGEYDRPEMFMSRGRQYLIPGNQGSVVPMGGGRGNLTQQFIVQGVLDNRTRMQLEQKTGTAARRAMARNGA